MVLFILDLNKILPNEIKKNYKCLVPIYPQATNAIFSENDKGELTYLQTLQDEDPIEPDHPYIKASHGDSGGGVWTKANDPSTPGTKEKRNTIIAIFSNFFKTNSALEKAGWPLKCVNLGTKLSEEVIQWIKDLHSRM